MRLLLDSNVLFWSIFNRTLLTRRTFELLIDERNELFVSRASIWELSIKVARGRLDMPGSSIRYLLDQIEQTGITILSINDSSILRTETLPHHHGDPFDRMIVSQAMQEHLTILSSDKKIPLYDVTVIWN